MYHCKGCDNPVEELVECFDGEPLTPEKEATLTDVQAGQIYEGCPHCGSDEVLDLLSRAEAFEED